MNSIEKAREFLVKRYGHDGAIFTDLADYAESAVREREIQIADELEMIIDECAGSTNEADYINAYIARLRSETK